MLPVGPVNMCFLKPHDWKNGNLGNSALQKSMSIISVDATHPQNFPQCQGTWPSHVQGVYSGELPGDIVGQVTWYVLVQSKEPLQFCGKMNVWSAQIKKNSVLQISAVCFFWRSTVYLAITCPHSLHHTSSFHFSFHFLLFLWVHFCLVRLSKDPRG